MMRAVLVLLALAAPAAASERAPHRGTFACARGVILPVVFPDSGGAPLAVAWMAGDLRLMPIARSASGARYREARDGYQLWIKGDAATLFYGPEAAPQLLLSECRGGPGSQEGLEPPAADAMRAIPAAP